MLRLECNIDLRVKLVILSDRKIHLPYSNISIIATATCKVSLVGDMDRRYTAIYELPAI